MSIYDFDPLDPMQVPDPGAGGAMNPEQLPGGMFPQFEYENPRYLPPQPLDPFTRMVAPFANLRFVGQGGGAGNNIAGVGLGLLALLAQHRLAGAERRDVGRQEQNQRFEKEAAFKNQRNIAASQSILQRMNRPTSAQIRADAQARAEGTAAGTPASTAKLSARRALTAKEAQEFGVPAGTEMALEEITSRLTALRTLDPSRYGASMGGGLSAIGADPVAIADAIERGDQPPDLTGLGRATSAVRSELGRRKFDLTRASADWKAATRYYSGLNTSLQLRLRQAIENGYETALEAERISERLGTLIPRSNLTLANKGILALAREGLLGGAEATGEAQQLVSFVNALQFELANVYMGGGVPTDQATAKATEIVNPNMSPARLKAAITAAKRELAIRRLAISQAGMVSPSNPPTGIPQTGINIGNRMLQTGGERPPDYRYNPATKKLERVAP